MTTTEIKDGRLVLLSANDGNSMDSIHASEIAAMARELLDHRRASQDAPSEAHVCELNRAMNGECMECGSIDEGMAEKQRQADLRHAQAAPAPSDGLREAAQAVVNDVRAYSKVGERGSVSWTKYLDLVAALRAALSTPTEERQ